MYNQKQSSHQEKQEAKQQENTQPKTSHMETLEDTGGNRLEGTGSGEAHRWVTQEQTGKDKREHKDCIHTQLTRGQGRSGVRWSNTGEGKTGDGLEKLETQEEGEGSAGVDSKKTEGKKTL